MPTHEDSHIALQRFSQIDSGEALSDSESVHVLACPECRQYIENEKVLTQTIAAYRKKKLERESL